jgi:hypothetical protein
MVMNWQNSALALAGVVGGITAVIHGVLTQRLMVRPIEALMASDRRISGPVKRLIPLLMHFSTIAWLAGGLALIVAACWLGPQARLATALCVGGLYFYGALGNLWGTRGRHPGWMLMTAALGLIGLGIG